jgi:hypothetical protein
MRSTIFSVINPCISDSPNFLPNISLPSSRLRSTLASASACFLLGLLFDPEDEDDLFLRNVGLFSNYTALQTTR